MKTEYKTRSKKLRVCDQYIFVLTPFANVAYVFPVNENVPPYRLKFLQDSKKCRFRGRIPGDSVATSLFEIGEE